MSSTYPLSFRVSLVFIFLIPIFFVPGGSLYLDSAKSALFTLSIAILSLLYLYESYRQGSLSFPKNFFLATTVLLPVVYLISALLSTPSSLSLLGYSLEVSTFGFILLGCVALILVASIYTHTSRFLQALTAFFASLSLLALFVVTKILWGGEILSLGLFVGNMGNPLGTWTDLAVIFGLLAALSALTIGMIPMRTVIKTLLYGVFAVSTILLIVLNFFTALCLSLGAALLILIYFLKIEKNFNPHTQGEIERKSFFKRPVFLPLVLGIFSLIMLINPTISENRGKLGNIVADTFNVSNIDVKPSLSATLGISKAVLSQASFLGSGPNTFGNDWLIFKPVSVNATPFWAVTFPFGIGFIPTQIATTGILGTVLWLVFFALLFILSFKILSSVPESRASRFTLITTLFTTLFLWIAAIVYTPSASILILSFIFAGLLVAASTEIGITPRHHIDLKHASPIRYVALISMVLVAVGSLYFGFIGAKKTVAAYHFKKAINISNIQGTSLEEVERKLNQAVDNDPVDLYYTAISRLNFSKAQAAATSESGTAEINQAIFEEGIRNSIEAARLAVTVNPASYGNWVGLGNIYAALVPAPLSVEGAYENAQLAYNEALKRNPNNPELPLFLAQLELAKGDVEAARSYIRNSIALKDDYADAYLLLAQLEVRENNIPDAITSAEALSKILPQNAGIHFELGLLKYSLKNYTSAVESLSEAVRLIPDYANAKYYLGLTYKELGRIDEARTQFEDLLVTNPDNAELKAALDGLNSSNSSRR